MSPLLVRFGIVPGLVLLPLTLVRLWLELNHADSPALKFASTLALSMAFIVIAAILLLRQGVSFPRFAAAMLTFTLVVRIPLSIIYAMAWSGQWTTPAGAKVRYVEQVTGQMQSAPDTTALMVFAKTLFLSTTVHVIFAALAWFITWAIAFRGKRPPCSAAATVTP